MGINMMNMAQPADMTVNLGVMAITRVTVMMD